MKSRPSFLWIVRHGESAGNVALREALAAGRHQIEVSPRDADVPLSDLGCRQSKALGRWFGKLSAEERPTVVYSSPYARAKETTRLLVESGQLGDVPVHLDERLREKEFGVINRLTGPGIRAAFPEQAELRNVLGKFYYRPPGGESWTDIILRLRSFWESMILERPDGRALIVCHSAIALCMRYVLEDLDEEQMLTIDRSSDIANCSVTSYQRSTSSEARSGMALQLFNFVAPLEAAGEEITRAKDAPLPK